MSNFGAEEPLTYACLLKRDPKVANIIEKETSESDLSYLLKPGAAQKSNNNSFFLTRTSSTSASPVSHYSIGE